MTHKYGRLFKAGDTREYSYTCIDVMAYDIGWAEHINQRSAAGKALRGIGFSAGKPRRKLGPGSLIATPLL